MIIMVSDETKLGLFLGFAILGGILVAKFIMEGGLPSSNRAGTVKDRDNDLEKRYYKDGTWELFDTSKSPYKVIEFGTWDNSQPVPTNLAF